MSELLAIFEGVSASSAAAMEDRSGWPVDRRLEHRIIDGDRNGIEADLDEAMADGVTPLIIINDFLLAGMKTVGELFASGEMQLPFVLGSAETMKTAVAYLEPYMEKADQGGKGVMVLATVKGDVHDIGKNLVDIILTNNGYTVKNLGIKVGIADMVSALEEAGADAIGMSGLLVKSTLIMRENLEELNRRNLSHIPVILGGAALTRTYVERDLRKVYDGRLFYGKDAFEGLRTMDRLVELSRSGEDDPEFGTGHRRPRPRAPQERAAQAGRSRGPRAGGDPPDPIPRGRPDNPTFEPPFLGSRVAKGMAIDDIAAYLNETALFRNQWGFRPEAGEDDAAFKDRIRALLRDQLATAKSGQLLVPQVAWGHFAANADGDDLVLFEDESRTKELMRYTFPRQTESPWLCISDFFRPVDSGEPDWASFQVVTMGARVSEEAARLKADDQYQNYLYLHGLGVEMAEALAEYWHRRIREELGVRRRGRPYPDRPVPPEVPWRPLLVGLPGLPGPRGQRQGGRAARSRPHRHRGERGVPAPTRAVDHRDHLPSPPSQVLRGVGPFTCAVTPVAPSRQPGPRSEPSSPEPWQSPSRWWSRCGPSRPKPARPPRPLVPPLQSLMITQPLPGYTVAPAGPTDGPLTPAEFASQSTSPQRAEKQFDDLAAEPDFGAFIRLWTDGTGPGQGANDVAVLLFRIPRLRDAESFAAGLGAPFAGSDPFDVPSIPGARGYSVNIASPVRAVEQIVVFRAGQYVAMTELASSSAASNTAALTASQAVAVSFQQYGSVRHGDPGRSIDVRRRASRSVTAKPPSNSATLAPFWRCSALVACWPPAPSWALAFRPLRRQRPAVPGSWEPRWHLRPVGGHDSRPGDGMGARSARSRPLVRILGGGTPGSGPRARRRRSSFRARACTRHPLRRGRAPAGTGPARPGSNRADPRQG